MRANGVIVEDIPHHLSPNFTSSHSIYFPDEQLRIPLSLNGVISYFNTRRPTLHEIHTCINISLTNDSVEWNPYCPSFAQNEQAAENVDEGKPPDPSNRVVYAIASSYHRDPSMDLTDVIYHKVNSIMASTTTGNRRLQATAEDLSKKWVVGKEIAADTVKATTQSIIRSAIYPVERRFKTKNAALRYNHLQSTFYYRYNV